MKADWKPIETAPKDREIMVTDGQSVEPATWSQWLNQYYLDEPTTDDERHYVMNQHAEMLGAKELNLDGKPIRVVAYRYSDDVVIFHAVVRDYSINLRQTMSGEFIGTQFDDTTFWQFLLSQYRNDIALRS